MERRRLRPKGSAGILIKLPNLKKIATFMVKPKKKTILTPMMKMARKKKRKNPPLVTEGSGAHPGEVLEVPRRIGAAPSEDLPGRELQATP